MKAKRGKSRTGGRRGDLARDAKDLYGAVSNLVRVYQFRDRKRICYHDISVTQCYALSAILEHGPMTLGDLAADLYLDKSTASRVVDSLEKKGYVVRATDPADARALRLEVTETGHALHRRIVRDLVDEMKDLVRDLEPGVRAATIRLVSKLAKAASDRFSDAEAGPEA